MALEAGSDTTSIQLQPETVGANTNGPATTLAENLAVGSATIEPNAEMLRSTSNSSQKDTAQGLPVYEGIEHDEQQGGNSDCKGASFNFINSILGAGIIGLPFAVKECGLILGVVLLFLVMFLTYFSVQILIGLGIQTGRRDYEDLMLFCFGYKGYLLISFFMSAFAFGAMCSYFIIIGHTVPPVIESATGSPVSREAIISVCGLFFVLPLCLLKDMAKLAWSSFISVTADLLIVVIVCVRAQAAANEAEPPIVAEIVLANPERFFAGVGVISFAFVCQHSTFIVFNTLREPTSDEWRRVSVCSLSFVSAACLALALGGYLAFGELTGANILNNFSTSGDWLIDLARILLALTMVLTFPMENFVARHAINSVFFKDRPMFHGSSMSDAAHYGITIGLFAAALTISLLVDDLGVVLELVGAFAGSAIGYVLPALCFLKVRSNETKKNANSITSERVPLMLAAVWFMLIFGMVAMVVGTILAFME